MGEFAKAEPLYLQALAIDKEVLGEMHPDYAETLNNLALLYVYTRNFSKAESLFRQSLAIKKQVLGERHPSYAESLSNLAGLYLFMGDAAKAEPLSAQALRIGRENLDAAAGVQSERQQLRMASIARAYLVNYLSIAALANVPAEDVYAHVLAWKGAVSARQRAMRRLRQSLDPNRSPELARLFDDLEATSRELSNQSQRVPSPDAMVAHRQKLAELSDRIERLQKELAANSQEFRRQLEQQRRAPEDIRHALPRDTALVDLLEYAHITPASATQMKPVCEQQLVAFIVRPDRPVERVELGALDPITAAIEAWRKNFGMGRSVQTADPAQELRRRVWDKLEPHLQGAKTVLLSPDGATVRFPWPALPGKKPGTYLIEETAIAIVPIPRLLPELLASDEPAPARDAHAANDSSLLLIGDVNFDADPGKSPIDAVAQIIPPGTRGGELHHWPALPGTRTEIVTIADSFEQQFPDGRLKKLRDIKATKGEVVSQLDKYRYVHFATHGFFAPTKFKSALADRSGSETPGLAEPIDRQDISGFHPGLLSGLVLAGANRTAEDGKDDGILTALEVGELNLSHVELATLSACETGLGESAGGEGLLEACNVRFRFREPKPWWPRSGPSATTPAVR